MEQSAQAQQQPQPQPVASLKSQFGAYARFVDGGGAATDGTRITLSNLDFWFKQAKLLDDKILNRTDTGVCFNKMKSRTISYPEFLKFLNDLAARKDMEVKEIKIKLCSCGLPGADEKKPEKKKFGT